MYTPISAATKADSQSTVELAPFYYLDNFRALLDAVVAQYADLLRPEELGFATGFAALQPREQALMVRIYSRQGPLLRSDRLVYAELPDLPDLLESLAAKGWLLRNPATTREVLLSCLTRAELTAWCGAGTVGRRADRLASAQGETQDILARVPFVFIEPCHRPILRTFMDLFFGNRHQDLSTFVVSQLGHVRYPRYALDSHSRFFRDRAALEHFGVLAALREQVREIEEARFGNPGSSRQPPHGGQPRSETRDSTGAALLAIAHAIPDLPADDPLRPRADRLRNRIARQLERLDETSGALEVYAGSLGPPARERRARILFKRGDPSGCESLCQAMSEAPLDYSEEHFARHFLPRCQKKRGIKVTPPPVLSVPIRHLTLPGRPVEGLENGVARHLSGAGSDAFHLENWLFNALFGLLFWDCLYQPVRGAFMHPFQTRPADLFEAGFAARRRAAIEQVFHDLETEPHRLAAQVQETWQRCVGYANPFVGWLPEGDRLLQRALAHLPASHLSKVFRHLLGDLRNHASGFPDLLVLHGDGGYELIEIKGPGDQVRPNQAQWLDFFAREGIPAALLRVDWPP